MNRAAFVHWVITFILYFDLAIVTVPTLASAKGYPKRIWIPLGVVVALLSAIIGLLIFIPVFHLVMDVSQTVVGLVVDTEFAEDLHFKVSVQSGDNFLPLNFEVEDGARTKTVAFIRAVLAALIPMLGAWLIFRFIWRFLPSRTQNNPFRDTIQGRQMRARLMYWHFLGAIIIGLVMLIALTWNVVKTTFTLAGVSNSVDPMLITNGRELGDLSKEELGDLLYAYTEGSEGDEVKYVSGRRARTLIQVWVWGVNERFANENARTPIKETLGDRVPDSVDGNLTYRDLADNPAAVRDLLIDNVSSIDLETIIITEIVKPRVVKIWTLDRGLFDRDQIEDELAMLNIAYREQAEEEGAIWNDAELEWRSWLSPAFLQRTLVFDAELTGMRNAILGTLWIIGFTALIAFPIGIGAAIYLEEYAGDTWINRVIQTNIDNLAGVPSIIYGLLGVAIFVRSLEFYTSGRFVGIGDPTTANGRTVISAAFTMALLILPIIIINSQEAIQAVQSSIRLASFGLGATKWQTVSRQVLPSAMPGILTGTILAVSRAIGETAPLLVVGGIVFITQNPQGPFSRFTALPLQIYYWTGRPRDADKSVAAGVIIILLVILLMLNSTAIFLRGYFEKKLRGR